jgi:hypothetical protein
VGRSHRTETNYWISPLPRKKRIRDLKRPAKGFPVCREIIERRGWVAHVLCDAAGTYWDGFTVIDGNNNLVEGLSDSFRKQMIIMIMDGHFGDEVKDAFLDQTRYWKIRDALITWPNQEKIEKEALRVLDARPKGH